MAEITMPQLGETVTEGTITRWAKQVGESVAEDEILFEVSTDKVDSEVPSPVSGTVTEIAVPEGETVAVGTVLAVISDTGFSPNQPDRVAMSEASPETRGAGVGGLPSSTARTAHVETQAEGSKVAVAALGTQGSSSPEPNGPRPIREEQPEWTTDAAGKEDRVNRVLSPVVRRLIVEHDLHADQISGTGAGGRITRADVLKVIERRSGSASGASPAATTAPLPPAPTPAGPPASATSAPPLAGFAQHEATEHDTVLPFSNIRRRTAEHMIFSKHTSAHAVVAVEVDFARVESARVAANNKFREAEGFRLTYLPFVSRAVVDAIREFPHVNSSVGEDSLIVHDDINLGIAVDIEFQGLLVPVVQQADGKRLRALARDIHGLAGKARAKRLTVADVSGGTVTITNAGQFGAFITVPVINQPEVAILAVDAVKKRPVVVELPDGTDSIAIRPIGNLVLSWDHRAFDGAYAAAFLRAIKEVLETRDWAAEL